MKEFTCTQKAEFTRCIEAESKEEAREKMVKIIENELDRGSFHLRTIEIERTWEECGCGYACCRECETERYHESGCQYCDGAMGWNREETALP